MINRKQPPAIVDPVDFKLHLKPYETYTLKNGVPLYCVDAGAEEVVQLELVFFAGNWYEDQKSVAAATNFLLKNGTKSRSAFQINEAFEYYGAYCNRSCYSETAVLSLHSLSKYLPQVLPVMTDILTESVFPQEELDIFTQNSKQRLSVNLKKAEFVAGRKLDELLYGATHPYGKYSNAEDLDALQVEQLKAFYDRFYKHGEVAIFVAGKLPQNMHAQLESAFGALDFSAPQFQYPNLKTHPSAEKKHSLQVSDDAVQTAIRMGTPFPNRHHPDFYKAIILNTIFGGFFGSRLMSNIREEKGYTYGIHSYIQNHVHETAWVISTEVGKDVGEATIREVYAEMKRLREEPIPQDELMLVRNYMLGNILGDLDGPFQIMAKWKNIILNQLSEDYFYNSLTAIRETDALSLQQLAQKYLQDDNFFELQAL